MQAAKASRQLMLVDDDPMIRMTVELLLDGSPYELIQAEDGEKCLELMKSGFQGTILMDVMMPKMDGWQVLEEISRLGLMNGVVVCMFTAVVNPGKEGERVAELAIEYLRKPFSLDELLDKLRECSSLL